jgi:hypothetical protein
MSIKLTEGQLEFWQMASSLSHSSHSLVSRTFREHVSNVAQQQSFAPDILPTTVDVTQHIDQETGKLVASEA